MDAFDAAPEWMYHAVVPPDLQPFDHAQPAPMCVSEPPSHQAVPATHFVSPQRMPAAVSASYSGATHLELPDSLTEHTEHGAHIDQLLLASMMSYDVDVSTSTQSQALHLNAPEVDACSKLYGACFASSKERIKHELEMALRKPPQEAPARPNSEHSFVSTQAHSMRTATATATATATTLCTHSRVSKNKRAKHSKAKRTRAPAKPWSEQEHQRFKESLELYGRDWEKCAKYIGTRRAQLVRSHAQKYLIKLWKLGLPLPKKVAESGRGYTLSGKPLLAESASARSYLTRISGPAVPLNQMN